MSGTKNVKFIQVHDRLFNSLCDSFLDVSIKKLQENYKKLENILLTSDKTWLHVKDEDLYIYTKEKVLIPDTRKIKPTGLYLPGMFDGYGETYLEFLDKMEKNNSEEAWLNTVNSELNENNWSLPAPFESSLFGLPAKAPSCDLINKLKNDSACPFIGGHDKRGFNTLAGRTSFVIDGEKLNDNDYVYNMANTFHYGVWNNPNAAIYLTADEGRIRSALKFSIHEFPKEESLMDIVIRYALYPDEVFQEEEIAQLKVFHSLYVDGIDVMSMEEVKAYLKNKNISELLGINFNRNSIEKEILEYEINLSKDDLGQRIQAYLNDCDYVRARIQRYNSRWYLSDEGKGHWELWTESEKSHQEEEQTKKKTETAPKHIMRLSDGAIARNPLADVKHDAVVGIDFGTKSTIVALQDGDEDIIPMRVGMADYSVSPLIEHYENPTVIQFLDLVSFMEEYEKRLGRPLTSWDEVKISHEAFKNMIDSNESREYSSFISDIKQWASGRYGKKNYKNIIIKDGKGNRFDLKNYLEITSEDIDPVELYAYYLGLFINNMHTGIYLDYLLSFPETFSVEIKNKVLESFKRGIKKSIPSSVFEDDVCSSAFRVRQGASEPAAYAACAIEQYGIEPTDQGIVYGVFDFGGGTTDFDYGIWKNAPEDELTYNYIIRHFGSGGDSNLGGENILQLLAYYVFSDDEVSEESGKSNLQIMRENKIVYLRPDEGKAFPGSEMLISEDESAVLNSKLLMEALRPLWEEPQEVRDWINQKNKKEFELEYNNNAKLKFDAQGKVSAYLHLFSEEGNKRTEVELQIIYSKLNDIMLERIEKGIRNFFEGLCFSLNKNNIATEEPIHIFLGGNASKSRRVQRIFEYYMTVYDEVIAGNHSENYESLIDVLGKIRDKCQEGQEESSRISDEKGENGIGNLSGRGLFKLFSDMEKKSVLEIKDVTKELEEREFRQRGSQKFLLFPALGTDEAKKIQKLNKVEVDKEELLLPTGKTGVAFGLVMCREGSMIRVESEVKKDEQIKLSSYIGINYRKKFKMIFDRNIEYNQWLKFLKTNEETETFELFYTELPEVKNGDVVIKGNSSIHKKKCMIDKSAENASIYFRFINPFQLEYVVAYDDKIQNGEYVSSIYKVDLEL